MTFKRSFSSTVLAVSVVSALALGVVAGRATTSLFSSKPPQVETQPKPVDSKCATELKSSEGYAEFLTSQLDTKSARIKEFEKLNDTLRKGLITCNKSLQSSDELLTEGVGIVKEAQKNADVCQAKLNECAGILDKCRDVLDQLFSSVCE